MTLGHGHTWKGYHMAYRKKMAISKPIRKISKEPILLTCCLGFAASRIGKINAYGINLPDGGFPTAVLPTNTGFLEKGP